jgi:hypothetical protein
VVISPVRHKFSSVTRVVIHTRQTPSRLSSAAVYADLAQSELRALHELVGTLNHGLSANKPTDQSVRKGEKNPWLLGEMSENRFPDARGREEG